MARNDDRARDRRAKRRGENPSDANEAQESTTPAVPDAGGESTDPVGSEVVRAETDSHAALTGSPVGPGAVETDELAEQSAFEPDAGGAIIGGEVSSGKGPRVFRFFRASWQELRRVRWPNRQQVGQGTVVTLGFVILAGIFFGIADFAAREIVNLII